MKSVASVKDRLNNKSKATGKTMQELLTAYGLERALEAEYDSLYSGIITRDQFLSSFSMLKIYFSMKEADLLYEKYTNPEKENIMD